MRQNMGNGPGILTIPDMNHSGQLFGNEWIVIAVRQLLY